ncbi:DciA family protein [Chitinilyticum piscinae]|uniref:DUF721 domain-containing protein n=1 Tax=Chitinilyticum piscinae TaxID=2866724 RepID=A0A8J7FHQ6_9NEIS|nr:DciA family protein [Chitinilyticum piscinae]MBE9607982.1 DUF721 domain-containing protein [Chitinilyticum piscinae]
MKRFSARNPLQTDPQLRPLLRQVAELERVLQALRRSLPTEVAACCLAASWSGNQLIVAVSSGAAAMRLKQCAPAALRQLQATGIAVSQITPRISSALLPAWQPPKTLAMTDAATRAFETLADQVHDDGLKDAIHSLLAHHAKRRL